MESGSVSDFDRLALGLLVKTDFLPYLIELCLLENFLLATPQRSETHCMSHSLSFLLVGIVSRVVVPPVGLGLEEVVYIDYVFYRSGLLLF